MRMIDRLAEMERRYEELGEFMSRPEIVEDIAVLQKFAREHAGLESTVRLWRRLQSIDREMTDTREILSDGADEELRELARETLAELQTERETTDQALREALIARDPNDDHNAIVEIRGAAGGEEAN